MQQRILSFLLFFNMFGSVHCQVNSNQSTFSSTILSSAKAMTSFFKSGDYSEYVKYLHPVIIQAAGGEAKMIELLNSQNVQLKSKGIVINTIEFDVPTKIVKNKNELQCTIAQHTELKSANGRVITHTTLIVISNDNGKTWKFVDTNNMDIVLLKKLFPNLSNEITLPPKEKPTVYSQ